MLFVRNPLKDLSKCNSESQSKGYNTLADILISLDDLNSLPLMINIFQSEESKKALHFTMQNGTRQQNKS